MKIYDKLKTKELNYEELDFEKGYLQNDVIVHHIEAQHFIKEEGHYETLKEYPNRGKDVKWVVDKKGQDAVEEHDEEEQIQVFVEFTAEELKEHEKQKRIVEIQLRLQELSQDFIQAQVGAVFDDLKQRKEEFKILHNELRQLLGKEIREYTEGG